MSAREPCIEVVDDKIAEILRGKTAAERVSMILEANRVARNLVAAGIRERNPHWSAARVERELARRMLGDVR